MAEFIGHLKREKPITFGPRYRAQIKDGSMVELHTGMLEYPNDPPCFSVLATDDSGHVIGFREIELMELYRDNSEHSDTFSTGGYVHTLKRGQGLHVLLEKTMGEILQTYANKTGKPIQWSVANANEAMLEDMQEEIDGALEDSYQAFLLEKKFDEQEAWMTTYKNRLGFSIDTYHNAQRLILPDITDQKELSPNLYNIDYNSLTITPGGDDYDPGDEREYWKNALLKE